MMIHDKGWEVTIHGVIKEKFRQTFQHKPSCTLDKPIIIKTKDLFGIYETPSHKYYVLVNMEPSVEKFVVYLKITQHEYIQLAKHFFPHKLYKYTKTYDEITTPTTTVTNAILSLNLEDKPPIKYELMRI